MQLQSKKADLIAFVIGEVEKCQLGVCRAHCHLGDSKVARVPEWQLTYAFDTFWNVPVLESVEQHVY